MLILIYLIIKGTDSKFKQSFLRPILAKIELRCQEPALPQLSGVHPNSGVLHRIAGGSPDGLAMMFYVIIKDFKYISLMT